jgi:hypothetical protein
MIRSIYTVSKMRVAVLPCGCKLAWDEYETDLAFCEYHDIEYERWTGTDTSFIKRIATPSTFTDKPFLIQNVLA